MQASKKPIPTLVSQDKPLLIATFKNSLLAWRERYRAKCALGKQAVPTSTRA